MSLILEGDNSSECFICSPDSPSQTSQLNDLAMIDEEIGMCTAVLNVIGEHFRISCFEPRTNLLSRQTEDRRRKPT
jgi:hypothetical protein